MIRCLLCHRYNRRLEFTPLPESDDDSSLTMIKVVDIKTCYRCGKQKRTEELVPFTYVIDDD